MVHKSRISYYLLTFSHAFLGITIFFMSEVLCHFLWVEKCALKSSCDRIFFFSINKELEQKSPF